MTATPSTVPEAAVDAAMAAAPDRHLGFPGGWEPALSRDDMRRVLEAAQTAIRADERRTRRCSAGGGSTHPASERGHGPMTDCPFCKRIAAGEFIISDEYAVAFEPLNPVTEGHLLVVPRKHVPDAGSNPLAASHTMALAAEIAGPLEWADSYNLITSAGAAATQTVPHLHIHLVPRRDGDGLTLPWTGQLAAATQVVPGA